MSWLASYEAYEALDALPRYGERHIDGKLFRLVAGSVPEDKLFCCVNRHCGLKEHFTLVEAVEFALRGELVPSVSFMNPDAPFDCSDCGARVKPRRNSVLVLHYCVACMIDVCRECLEKHLPELCNGRGET